MNELYVIQPKSTELDRWKIFKMPIKKMIYFNSNRIEEGSFIDEEKNKNKNKKIKKYKPFKKYKYIYKEKEEEENKKIPKNKIIDLPSYPIEDLESGGNYQNLIFKGENKKKSNILDYQALNQYFLNKIILEEEKKQKEINKKLNFINTIKSIKEPKKIYENYKGKNVNIDHNGKIVLIKEINIDNLQSEFLGINTKLNNKYIKVNPRQSILKMSQINKDNNKKEEKKESKKNNNDNQEIKGKIIAGSSFNHIYPEVGVNIKEGNEQKSGGNDFFRKYKKYDINKFNTTMMNIYKESYYKSRNFNNSTKESNFNNMSNNGINISNIKDEDNSISNFKTIYKSISLPDIKKKIYKKKKNEDISFNNKILGNNSMLLNGKKYGSYLDSYLIQNDIEDNYIKYGKNIKASESFQKIMLNKEENEINNYYKNKSTLNNNNIHKKKNLEMYSYNNKNTFNYINDFNITILKDKNWGNSSFINNNSFNTSHNWSKKRFHSKILKNNNPYSTMRLREKKIIEKNKTDKYFNISNPQSNNNEKEFILKYLNKKKEN